MAGKFGPRVPSNANLFAKRGNPWVTQREGIKDFGREPSVLSGTENPDMDCFTRATMAKPHHEKGPDKPISPRGEAGTGRIVANRVRRMHQEMNAAKPVVVVPQHSKDANLDATGVPYESRPGEKRARPEAFRARERKPILSIRIALDKLATSGQEGEE